MKNIISVSMFALLAIIQSASAQFVGDVFYDDPSVSIEDGGTVEFDLLVFTGVEVVGGVEVVVTYDQNSLTVSNIRPGADFDAADEFFSRNEPGALSIIVANGSSVADPSGAIVLASFQVTATGAVGDRFTLATENKAVLTSDLSQITGGDFDAEIVIQSIRTKPNLNSTLDNQPNDVTAVYPGNSLYERLATLRRPGEVVELSNGDGSTQRLMLVVPE